MSFLRDERGQTLIMTALYLTTLLGFTGLAIDVGMLYRAQRTYQTAADAAAVAGALDYKYNASISSAIAAAQAASAANNVSNGVNGATVTVNIPPARGPNAGKAGFVEAVITKPTSTNFLKLFNLNSVSIYSRGVAALGAGPICVWLLGPTGTDYSANGSTSFALNSCSMWVDSSSSSAISMVGGASLSASAVDVVGGYSGGSITPTPVTGVSPRPDPLSWLPTPTPGTCSADPNFHGGGTLTPGCYNGLTVKGSGTVTLNPGFYYINGDINFGGSSAVTGTGVTIYFTGAWSQHGGGGINLTAPTSGQYNGMAIWEAAGDANNVTITGGAGQTLTGIIYAPNGSVTVKGSTGWSMISDIITPTMTLTGSTSMQNYAQQNQASPLSISNIVE